MADGYILVLDAGTSIARCFVFDGKGVIVGSAIREWSYLDEPDAPMLARAFDPRGLWPGFCELIKTAMKDAEASPGQVAAATATCQRQSVVFLDDAGQEIYAGPNLDLRAVFEGGAIDDRLKDRVYGTTGHLPSFLLAPAKLRWFEVNRPDAYDRIASVLTLADWLVWRLTGVLASERTLAGEAGLLDITSGQWCSDLLNEIGVLSDPVAVVEAGTLAGRLSADASVDTGLREGVPVAVAGADTQCGLLGMGLAQEGQLGIVAGWSAPLQMVTSRPVLSPELKTWAGGFLESGKWVLESNPGDLGNSYRWLAGMLYGGEDAFDEMGALADAVPVGSDGSVALLGHGRMDAANLGMRYGGFMFPVPVTFSDLGRGHLVRASLEAIAYAVRANLEQIEELAGCQARDVTFGGGMTLTPTFAKILTDVLGERLRVSPTAQVGALGAYLCARTALGEYSSLKEAASSVRPLLRDREPDPVDSAEYQDLYQRWNQLSAEFEELRL